MATYIRNNDIIISVDPGYDSTKVCINGILLKIPNNIIDITGHETDFLTLGEKKANGYICSKYLEGKEYLVGNLARKSSLEKGTRTKLQVKKDTMDSYDRFETTDFEVNLMTVIGIALIEYAKQSERNDWKDQVSISYDENTGEYIIPSLKKARLIIGIALPNDAVDQVWPNIERILTREHKFGIETSDGNWRLEFSVTPGLAMTASQVVCALLGAAGDDNGTIKADNEILRSLPTVVIDGGYKTVGIFMLTQAHKVAEAESNTDFAMGNVHKKVAQILREEYGRTTIESYQIPSILEEDDGIVTYKKDDVTDKVDIKTIILEEEKKLCDALIEYLNEKFEDLLDVKQLLITGGTGAAYFNHISSYMSKKRNHLEDKVILTDYKFRGSKMEPVYAIAVGMFKTLKNQVIKAQKAQKAEKTDKK